MNWTALAVFVALFLFVTGLGFFAARWRRGDLDLLHEWGLGGRRFGTFVTWFLLGGDLYTAYTFIAVPALMFGAGALGFFAVPYTVMVYPILYLVFPRLWTVAHRHGFVTAADFVRGRFGNRWLALAVALTGLLATMPYIALQLVGMQVVIGALGVETSGFVGDLPLIIAFVILAAFTYSSGLRAPALIAVVKDVLIYITVIAAVIAVPAELGGYGAIFAKVPAAKQLLAAPPAGSLGSFSSYATLALGSALALFLYPHAITGILSSSSARVIRRNAAILPAYSLVLGLIALLGFMAIAYGVQQDASVRRGLQALRQQLRDPGADPEGFPELVRRRRVRRHRDRRARPGGHHVDRYGQPVHPQHLPRVHQSRLLGRGGKPRRQDHVAGGQVGGARLHLRARPALCVAAAAARWRMDDPDPALGGAGALHAPVPRLGPADRLGGRDRARHLDGLDARL